jgi:3-hydroxyisobutyrate dehydrogenase-like beta-hydroxyacid dehydrogenase
MAKISFLGLGQMGRPISTRLLRAGHHVTVWDRTPSAMTPLVELGATAVSSAAAAGAGVDVAITMVPTPEAVDQILFGPDGLAEALGPGQIYVDMSTIGPAAFRSIASGLPEGVQGVDAPVRGSVPEATAGTLQLFVGASDDAFQRVRPILATLGDVHHLGGPGSGAAMKLVSNLTLGAAIVAFGEALALARSFGLNREAVLDVLAESPIGPAVKAKRANVEAGRYPASFKLRLAAKDMRLVDEAAEAAGIDLTEAHAAREVLEGAMERGAADLDVSAVIPTILGEEA